MPEKAQNFAAGLMQAARKRIGTKRPEQEREGAPAAIQQETQLETMLEGCRAQLAASTMERTAVLSRMAEQFAAIAPGGANRYQAIVDSFVMAGCMRIAGFGNGR